MVRGKWKIKHHVGANIYWFGDGNLVEAVENVDLPIAMGNNYFSLESPWNGQAGQQTLRMTNQSHLENKLN